MQKVRSHPSFNGPRGSISRQALLSTALRAFDKEARRPNGPCRSISRRALLSTALRAFDKEARRPLKLGLLLFVCMRFQDLFHSPSGVLFAFPSRYLFTIGRLRVFSLGGWSPHVQTGFHVSRPTCRALSSTNGVSCTGLSPAMAGLSRPFHYTIG